MEEFELFPDEEEEASAEEGANRTFIILVGTLGGLLALGFCLFAVWAFVINPRMTAERIVQNQSIEATNAALAETGTATVETPPDTVEPPAPSDTPEPAATEPPTAEPDTPEATPAEAFIASTATATPKPAATRRPTATPKPGSGDVPETGVGTLGASALAVGLLLLLIAVRRMRQTA